MRFRWWRPTSVGGWGAPRIARAETSHTCSGKRLICFTFSRCTIRNPAQFRCWRPNSPAPKERGRRGPRGSSGSSRARRGLLHFGHPFSLCARAAVPCGYDITHACVHFVPHTLSFLYAHIRYNVIFMYDQRYTNHIDHIRECVHESLLIILLYSTHSNTIICTH